jgi:hypothetical protein
MKSHSSSLIFGWACDEAVIKSDATFDAIEGISVLERMI